MRDAAGPSPASIGPNGAGKTTLINVLSGFVRPAAGTVEIDGQDLKATDPQARRFGIRRTFQNEQMVENLTVEDNIARLLDNVPRGGLAAARTRSSEALRLRRAGRGGADCWRRLNLSNAGWSRSPRRWSARRG